MFIKQLIKQVQWVLSCIGLIALGYVAGATQGGGAAGFSLSSNEVAAQDGIEATLQLSEHEKALAELYNGISPSVVAINITDAVLGELGGGSGFVLDTEGHIVTNFHVIDELDTGGIIEVEFFDGTITRAEIVAHDPDSDLGLLKVDVEQDRLFPARFGDSSQLIVGQLVIAIGSPFGQDWTLTSGIISALNRDIRGMGSFRIGAVVQTDAAINPGNSGGPLLNMAGEIIGINTQIFSPERANSGVGFAVPSNLVRRVINELLAKGVVDYAYLGVFFLEDVDLRAIERLNLPNNTRGVIVTSLQPDGPAEISGLQQNDVILEINGEPMFNFAALIGYLGSSTLPEQTIKVTVLRGGKTFNLDIKLGRRP